LAPELPEEHYKYQVMHSFGDRKEWIVNMALKIRGSDKKWFKIGQNPLKDIKKHIEEFKEP